MSNISRASIVEEPTGAVLRYEIRSKHRGVPLETDLKLSESKTKIAHKYIIFMKYFKTMKTKMFPHSSKSGRFSHVIEGKRHIIQSELFNTK